MRLIRLKVRTRIYLGFAVLVALSLGIAAFGVYQLSGVSTNVGKMDILATNTQRVLTITRQLEAIRRAETRYLVDAPEASMKDARDNASAANALLTGAIKIVLSDERRKAYHAVQDTLRAHLTNLNQFGQLSTTWVAERGRLFAAGDALTAATDKLVAAARASNDENAGNAADRIERTMLLVRLASWQFVATQDSAGVGTFRTNAANARTALAGMQAVASPEVAPLIAPVQTALAAYEASFTAYSTARLAVAALYNDPMRPTDSCYAAAARYCGGISRPELQRQPVDGFCRHFQRVLAAGDSGRSGAGVRQRPGLPDRARHRPTAGHGDRRHGQARRW